MCDKSKYYIIVDNVEISREAKTLGGHKLSASDGRRGISAKKATRHMRHRLDVTAQGRVH